jgi:hypothetical protein
MTHAGHFDLSLSLLRELLNLPEEAVVSAVTMGREQVLTRRFTVFVEHPDLPEVAGGEPAPEISPVWERDAEGRVKWVIFPG